MRHLPPVHGQNAGEDSDGREQGVQIRAQYGGEAGVGVHPRRTAEPLGGSAKELCRREGVFTNSILHITSLSKGIKKDRRSDLYKLFNCSYSVSTKFILI